MIQRSCVIVSYDIEKKIFQNILKKRKQPLKHKISIFILLAFLLINTALLIAVSSYCYLIKHWPKQEHSLLFHSTNKKLKEIMY